MSRCWWLVLAAAGFLGKRWFEEPDPLPEVPPVVIVVTQAEYQKRLKQREDEITDQLKEEHVKERVLLETELNAVQQRLLDTKASYQEHIKDLRKCITQLESLRGQISDELLNQAETALAGGDIKQADDLFRQVEEQAASAVKVAAEAAYQRCRIAYDAIRYRPALAHCQRAAQLAPENVVYLSDADDLAHILAKHRQLKRLWKELENKRSTTIYQ